MEELKWFYIFMIAAIIVLGVGALVEMVQEQEQMEACVEAGKDWIRDHDDYYECR